MSVDSAKALAKLVDAPEFIPFLEGCGKYTLLEVEDLLHILIAAQGHPSPTCRARLRVGLLNDIWNRVYGFNQSDCLRWAILDRIEHLMRSRDLQDLGEEFWVLANLWDAAESEEELYEEREAVDDWDYLFLCETYLKPTPSLNSLVNTAGRAIHYVTTGKMSDAVSIQDVVDYFGWDIKWSC